MLFTDGVNEISQHISKFKVEFQKTMSKVNIWLHGV